MVLGRRIKTLINNCQLKKVNMKPERIFVIGLFLICFFQLSAQTSCDNLFIDFETGTINGIKGTAEMDEVKKALPCFTGESEENTNGMNCGGGVFYLKHFFNVYTLADFIRIRENFKGEFSSPVFGVLKDKAIEQLGKPDAGFEHTDDWLDEQTLVLQYQKDWGVLSLMLKEGVVSSIEMHHGKKIADIKYCF